MTAMTKRRTDGDELTYLLRGIPPELWREVKATAALRGESVRDALLRFLAEYVKKPKSR